MGVRHGESLSWSYVCTGELVQVRLVSLVLRESSEDEESILRPLQARTVSYYCPFSTANFSLNVKVFGVTFTLGTW